VAGSCWREGLDSDGAAVCTCMDCLQPSDRTSAGRFVRIPGYGILNPASSEFAVVKPESPREATSQGVPRGRQCRPPGSKPTTSP
jgi:hypothetical protein